MREKTTSNPLPLIPITPKKKMTRHHSTPFPSCFRPSSTTTPALDYHSPPPPTTTTTTTTTTTSNPNLTTSLYQTTLGLFSLTWSRSLLSRSLHLHLHHSLSSPSSSSSSPSFHLSLKPFLFWNKQGFKKLTYDESETQKSIWVFWDFTNARFGLNPEPESGFYIAVVSNGEMTLLIGDLEKEAYLKTKVRKAKKNKKKKEQSLVLRREHVIGRKNNNKVYTTKVEINGELRQISIELTPNCEEELVVKFDQKRVFQVKHLKWKFRGSERVEIDNGVVIQLSWDVYNWLFDGEDCNQDDGYALFTFKFEKQGSCEDGETGEERERGDFDGGGMRREKDGVLMWSQDSCGLNYERKKMKKRMMLMKKSNRSPSFSSSSLSSASSGCSSVMEWESVEENELKGPSSGFSLLVYAWKS